MNLSELYSDPEKVSYLHSRYFVEGLLTGACACPEIPLPDTWLPWTLAKQGQIQDAKQADYIFEQLFAAFKSCLASMRDGELRLPDYAQYCGLENSNALQKYCSGIVYAHQSVENCWQQAWQIMQVKSPDEAPKLAKDLKHCLLVFSTFAEPAVAIAQANDRGEIGLGEKLPVIAKSLQSAMDTYVATSGALAAFLPNQFETFEQKAGDDSQKP
ncbi:UPF0149 family protein [Ningiella sp. W23]|uniref:UPF0149 family protein n=1 Tax=Ningiella sp. W23 TaxID=3023715 RepID=UPI003756F9D5